MAVACPKTCREYKDSLGIIYPRFKSTQISPQMQQAGMCVSYCNGAT